MFITLDKDLNIDTMRSNTMNTTQYFVNTAPNMGDVVVGPNKNMYFICGVRDSAKFLSDDPTVFYKGISLVKIDTFGNVLDVHQLTDTVRTFGNQFMCEIKDLTVNEDYMYISGTFNVDSLNFNGYNIINNTTRTGFLFQIDNVTYQNNWVKQNDVIGTNSIGATFLDTYKYNDSIDVVIFDANSFYLLSGTAIMLDGDTLISYHNGNSTEFPVFINSETGQKLNWDYPDGVGSVHINSIIQDNNELYLNYKYKDFYWQNLNIPAKQDWETSTDIIQNAIVKYNLNTEEVDTVTTYGFSHFNLHKSNTTTMIKMGDNFVVGGHFYSHGFFGDTTIYHSQSQTDMFIAKFGTDQCIFCDTAIANFSIDIDSFAITVNNNSIQADSFLWQIDSQNIVGNLTNYNFIDTGTHTVCLIAQNNCSADTLCKSIHIACPPIGIYFTVEQSALQVSLQNNSINTTSYTINWGDGTINQSLSHSYQTAGNYQICLQGISACATDSACINVEVITGMENIYANNYTVNMHPNPAKNELFIEWNNIEKQDKSIELYNAFGQKIKTIKPNKNTKKQKISLKNITQGIYFVIMKVEGKKVWSEKLVVR